MTPTRPSAKYRCSPPATTTPGSRSPICWQLPWYSPWRRGHIALDGLEILIHQGSTPTCKQTSVPDSEVCNIATATRRGSGVEVLSSAIPCPRSPALSFSEPNSASGAGPDRLSGRSRASRPMIVSRCRENIEVVRALAVRLRPSFFAGRLRALRRLLDRRAGCYELRHRYGQGWAGGVVRRAGAAGDRWRLARAVRGDAGVRMPDVRPAGCIPTNDAYHRLCSSHAADFMDRPLRLCGALRRGTGFVWFRS